MRCSNHSARTAAGTCRDCNQQFCEDCLVHAFGEGRAPYCVDCALTRSGRAPSGSSVSFATTPVSDADVDLRLRAL